MASRSTLPILNGRKDTTLGVFATNDLFFHGVTDILGEGLQACNGKMFVIYGKITFGRVGKN
jgi:hypothetical protein